MRILGVNMRVERVGGNKTMGIIGGKLWPERMGGYQNQRVS
jgi:hypothetical protein